MYWHKNAGLKACHYKIDCMLQFIVSLIKCLQSSLPISFSTGCYTGCDIWCHYLPSLVPRHFRKFRLEWRSFQKASGNEATLSQLIYLIFASLPNISFAFYWTLALTLYFSVATSSSDSVNMFDKIKSISPLPHMPELPVVMGNGTASGWDCPAGLSIRFTLCSNSFARFVE